MRAEFYRRSASKLGSAGNDEPRKTKPGVKERANFKISKGAAVKFKTALLCDEILKFNASCILTRRTFKARRKAVNLGPNEPFYAS